MSSQRSGLLRGVLYGLTLEAALGLLIYAAVTGRYLLAGTALVALTAELVCTQSNAPDRTSGQMGAAEGVNRKEA